MTTVWHRYWLVILTAGFLNVLSVQAHIPDQARRDAYITKDVLKMKRACDDILEKGQGSTVETREASEATMKCLHQVTLDVAKALYFKTDIEADQLEASLTKAQDALLGVYAFTDQAALYCGPGADEGCSHNGGTMYQITPYGRVLSFYEDTLVRMCDMSASDPESVMPASWHAQMRPHADEAE